MACNVLNVRVKLIALLVTFIIITRDIDWSQLSTIWDKNGEQQNVHTFMNILFVQFRTNITSVTLLVLDKINKMFDIKGIYETIK